MLSDITDLERGARLRADVCIIGAGIAGITVARKLMGGGLSVILLESGGTDFDAQIQDLMAGRSAGLPYYALVDSRLRLFGGTLNIWGGRTAEMDGIDFEQRAWIPHSGWPVTHAEMQPWVEEARSLLGADAIARSGQPWAPPGVTLPEFDADQLRAGFWQIGIHADRLSPSRCRDLARARDVTVLTRATVTRLRSRADLGSVEEIDVAGPDGRRATVSARHFVLAAGGLENARLLLASNDASPHGLGNEHDLVGRFFMEHPHARGGRVYATALWRLLNLYACKRQVGPAMVAPCFRPGEGLQRRARILNSAFALACRPHPGDQPFIAIRAYRAARHRLRPTRGNRRLWRLLKDAARRFNSMTDPLRPWLLTRSGARGLYAAIRAEQAPNPQSRVYLGPERDALGVPRLVLDWRLDEIDKRTIRVLMQAFDSELRRLRLGWLDPEPWLDDQESVWRFDPAISNHPIGGYHHMGTTRMADHPSRGVVDRNCQVFGLDNLYVAGSSVFTTGSWANPTLTLTALSARLGDHLLQVARATHAPAAVAEAAAAP